MATNELRLCPFCANTNLTVATFGNEQTNFIVVACTECGAMGPRATGADPSGHAEHLWNQRFTHRAAANARTHDLAQCRVRRELGRRGTGHLNLRAGGPSADPLVV